MISDPGMHATSAATHAATNAATNAAADARAATAFPQGSAPGPGPVRATAAGELLANRTRALAVGSLVGLIVLSVAWELWLAPTGSGLLALKALPLLIPLVGLLRRRLYTYRWVSLFVWLYFIEGVVRATSDRGPGVWLAMIEVALCLALFAACSAHVWWRLKLAPAAEDGGAGTVTPAVTSAGPQSAAAPTAPATPEPARPA